MYGSLEDFPLRQKKFVRTRNSVLKVTTQLLEENDFDTITVDDICEKSQISRGTFFNYFPQKSHIFHYYIRIFTIKMMKRIEHWEQDLTFKEQIESIYKWFDEESQYPDFVNAYIDYLLKEGSSNNAIKLTKAEFVYFFTGIDSEDDYAYYNNLSIEGIIKELCIKAKAKGEIGGQMDDNQMAKVVLTLLVGPFITYKGLEPHAVPKELFDIMLKSVLLA